MSEWWANGPLGLEQGFALARRPAGVGELTFSLAFSSRVRFVHGAALLPEGLRYAGAQASDADGRALRAWLELRGRRVLLRVDDRGARYPLRVDPFIQQAKLTTSNGAANDFLGNSVAISGNTIAVGAPNHKVGSNTSQGAAYVFTMPAGGWANATQKAELTASNGGANDFLGSSVAISGNTVVAGAFGHKVGSNTSQGAAYVFTMPGGGWANATQKAELTASDGAANDALGNSVAISGNTVVAGAFGHKVGSNTSQGAAYVFTMPAGGWVNHIQTAELTASDGVATDYLGGSVAISGNTVVAGAPGSLDLSPGVRRVYAFTRPAGGWVNHTQTAELTASDGAPNDQLGSSVAISGNTIVAGAPAHQVGSNTSQGAAYVFTMPAGGWVNHNQRAELTASDGAPGDQLGSSVAVSGNTIAVGALSHKVGSNASQGAAYVFTMQAGGWVNHTQTAELAAGDGSANDAFGFSVAVSGHVVVVGAPHNQVGPTTFHGAAYVFKKVLAPVNTALPVVAGTRKTGQTLLCSTGTWAHTPIRYTYRWHRNGIPLPGETRRHYRVQISDEGTTLNCTVTASNSAGSATATSLGIKVPIPFVPRCPKATGSVTASTLGLIRIGMTHQQAEHAYRHSSNRGKAYEQFFCLTPHGVRVGYASPKLLKRLPANQQHLAGRVIWASTTNAYYAVAGIRPPSTLTAAKHALPGGNLFHIGKNDWYIAHHHGTTAVLKVRHGIVQEIGIGDPTVTKTRQAQHNFITSFE